MAGPEELETIAARCEFCRLAPVMCLRHAAVQSVLDSLVFEVPSWGTMKPERCLDDDSNIIYRIPDRAFFAFSNRSGLRRIAYYEPFEQTDCHLNTETIFLEHAGRTFRYRNHHHEPSSFSVLMSKLKDAPKIHDGIWLLHANRCSCVVLTLNRGYFWLYELSNDDPLLALLYEKAETVEAKENIAYCLHHAFKYSPPLPFPCLIACPDP